MTKSRDYILSLMRAALAEMKGEHDLTARAMLLGKAAGLAQAGGEKNEVARLLPQIADLRGHPMARAHEGLRIGMEIGEAVRSFESGQDPLS